MEKIAILTDSASNIEENIEDGIFLVPLYVNFGNESKKDLIEIGPDKVFSRIDENPFTSAPSIEDFREKIAQIKDRGYTKILAIGASKNLSGTINTMRIGLEAEDLEYRLIDSKTITMAEGLLVMFAKNLISEGLVFEKICDKISEKIKDLKVLASVSDLKHLIRGGRLTKSQGLIGSRLRINPILTIDQEGTIINYKSVVGKKRAVNLIAKETKKALENADKYYMALAYGADLYLEGPVTAVLGAHSGPSTYLVSLLKIS